MLGPEPFRRFTVNSIGKIISIENPEIDEWGYSVTFDDDEGHSKHIVRSNSTHVFKELTHADPEEMYTFLRTRTGWMTGLSFLTPTTTTCAWLARLSK